MWHFHELLVTIITIIAIALFFAGFVWRLYRGGPGADGRR